MCVRMCVRVIYIETIVLNVYLLTETRQLLLTTV